MLAGEIDPRFAVHKMHDQLALAYATPPENGNESGFATPPSPVKLAKLTLASYKIHKEISALVNVQHI
jgi:hypothetical protein